MRHRHVEHGAARLSVSEWGGEGPALMALHPGVGDSRIWQWCAPMWADAGRRVIAYDRRGFGDTEYVTETHDELADLRAITAATDSRPAVIVGNSLGGGLALDVALAHPEEVEALVLIAPSPSGYDYSTWQSSEAETEQDDLIAAADAAGDIDRVNRLEARYWLDGVDQPDGRVGGAARELMLEMNDRALRAAPVGEPAQRDPAWGRLGEIDVPVLIVVGEHDLPGAAQQCRELTAAIPQASLTVIDEAAHCPSLDQPEQLAARVIDFLHELAN